jgi:hypothetical protein
LSQCFEVWCDHCNPQASKVGLSGLWELAEKIVETDGEFINFLAPGVLWNCTLTLASELVSLRQSKSPPSLPLKTAIKPKSKRQIKKTSRRR